VRRRRSAGRKGRAVQDEGLSVGAYAVEPQKSAQDKKSGKRKQRKAKRKDGQSKGGKAKQFKAGSARSKRK
jgi:hypothetical protein